MLNLPNVLTGIRFLFIPVYLYVFLNGHVKMAFLVLVLAGVTDVLDGYIARTRGLVTEVGSMLDPLADKLMLLTAILSFLFSGMIPLGVALLLFIRDAGMIIGSAIVHFKGYRTIPANGMGKLTTVFLYMAILLIVFEIPHAVTFLWMVVIFAYVTLLQYLVRFWKVNSVDRKRAHF